MKNLRKLTAKERDLSAVWKAEGFSNKECARRLSRHPSTIGRELHRNRFFSTDGQSYYVAIHAQGVTKERRWKLAHGKQPLKNPDVYRYATEKLREGWSPDAITGRLKREHPSDRYWWITHETIYRWIYQKEQLKCERPWYEYLRRKQKKRRKQKGRKVHRCQIPDRVSISLREEVVNQRKQFGHYEGDTVEGKGHQGGLHTEIERMARKYFALKVNAINGEETIKAQQRIFSFLPEHARRSTPLDNGKENHRHGQLKEGLRMKTYFAHPYTAWERGSNEHGNWLLRYYFPKGTDFSQISQEEIDEVVEEINNRPRKILGYQTPNEVFNDYLKRKEEVSGVAIAI